MITRFLFLTGLLTCVSLANAATERPLEQPDSWQLLSYSSIPANKVKFSQQGMTITVDRSASPIIYPLKNPAIVDSVNLKLKVTGALNLKETKQGEKGADDFIFRLGVVYEGEKTLNFFQKAIAASWVKRLFSLAPKGTGVDHINFFNVYSDTRLADRKRVHPASELLREEFVYARQDKEIQLSIKPDPTKQVLALWISSDGDDTDSSYSVDISDFSLVIVER